MWRVLPSTSPNEDRIEVKFRELHSHREGAVVTYLTGGDPDPKTFLANSAALIEGGADIVEIGIPFSDPIADGPVIQASSMRALSNGTTPLRILDMIRELSMQFPVPFVVLSYYNPILAMGLDRFLQKAREIGADGAIVGSDLVRILGNHLDDPGQAETQLKKTVQSLKEATRLRSD